MGTSIWWNHTDKVLHGLTVISIHGSWVIRLPKTFPRNIRLFTYLNCGHTLGPIKLQERTKRYLPQSPLGRCVKTLPNPSMGVTWNVSRYHLLWSGPFQSRESVCWPTMSYFKLYGPARIQNKWYLIKTPKYKQVHCIFDKLMSPVSSLI
jgi:hypothetical protein